MDSEQKWNPIDGKPSGRGFCPECGSNWSIRLAGEPPPRCPMCRALWNEAHRRFVDPIEGSRPTDAQIEAAKRKLVKKWDDEVTKPERRRIARLKDERAELRRRYEREGDVPECDSIVTRMQAIDAELWFEDACKTPPSAQGLTRADYEPSETVKGSEPVAGTPYGWSAAQAEVYRLRAVEGLTIGQVAERRGTSRAAVSKLWREAKAKVEGDNPDTAMLIGEEDKGDHVQEVELTEDERQDRILALVFRHGLDGWAATIAVDDPETYALFEPEYALAA